jgi:hypothetical protein
MNMECSAETLETTYQGGFYTRESLTLSPVSACILLGSLFDPEEGGDMFLRNIGLSHNYTAFEPRRPCYFSLQSFL